MLLQNDAGLPFLLLQSHKDWNSEGCCHCWGFQGSSSTPYTLLPILQEDSQPSHTSFYTSIDWPLYQVGARDKLNQEGPVLLRSKTGSLLGFLAGSRSNEYLGHGPKVNWHTWNSNPCGLVHDLLDGRRWGLLDRWTWILLTELLLSLLTLESCFLISTACLWTSQKTRKVLNVQPKMLGDEVPPKIWSNIWLVVGSFVRSPSGNHKKQRTPWSLKKQILHGAFFSCQLPQHTVCFEPEDKL